MKYIVIGSKIAGMHNEVMVIFPECVVHVMAYDALVKGGCIPGQEHHPVSAGTIERGRCSGSSGSLHVQSRPEEDSTLFLRGGS